MKTKVALRVGRFLVVGLALLSVGACGEDQPVDQGDSQNSTPLRVDLVFANPKAGNAGDTLVVTARLQSSSNNEGDIPTMAWSATGGTFIEDNQLTVRWVAPAVSDLYVLTARATNKAGSATGQTTVFVGGTSTLVADEAGAITLIGGGPDFYYLGSTTPNTGTNVYRYSGTVTDATPPSTRNNFDTVFAPDRSFEAHWIDTVYVGPANAIDRPRHIHVGWFGSNTFQRITVDEADPLSQYRNQFTQPAISPNSHLVAFQGWLPNRYRASIDSFEVYAYDLTRNSRLRVTAGQKYPRNFYPSFSTDQQWLTFVADPTGKSRWEIWGAPVSGDAIDANPDHLVQLSSTGGAVTSGTPPSVKEPLRTWNPVSPDLAIAIRTGALNLIHTTSGGGTTEEVVGLPPSGVLEMAWSPDGLLLAAVSTPSGYGGAIYLVSGATASPLFTVPSGDAVRDLTWSPDGSWIVYRRSRAGYTWFEILDVDGGRLTAPIALTAGRPQGDVARYRGVMSMSSAWTDNNQLLMLLFKASLTKPGITALDLSPVVD